ncbi:MAG: hypothetical protein Q9163_005384 [Psora crenata]
MDQVNERFPLLKYKAWMTTRAEEGLSTAGGVAAPSGSRAVSLRNAEGVIPPTKRSEDLPRPSSPPAARESTEQRKQTPGSAVSPDIQTSSEKSVASEAKGEHAQPEGSKRTDTSPLATTQTHDSDMHPDDLEDDDQIRMAVPTEMMATPGDSCAICIDTLEDDDDVRGLTCGHAFHASCLDPWLTARRACCPLCKADYYVPKSRSEGEVTAEAERQASRRTTGQRTDVPGPPRRPFTGNRQGRPRMLLPGRFMTHGYDISERSRYGIPDRRRPGPERSQTTSDAPGSSSANPDNQQEPRTWRSRLTLSPPKIRLPALFKRNNCNTSDTPAETGAPEISATTPGQLEAGQR